MTTFIGDHFTQYWSPEQSVTKFVTDQLDAVTGRNVAQASSDVSFVGEAAGQTVSPRSSLVISLKTAVPRRDGRGRMYWPSPASDGYGANGEFLTPLTTEISGAFRNALAAMAATAEAVIYHRGLHTWDSVTQVRVGSIPGTQRRRTNKVVNNYISTNV